MLSDLCSSRILNTQLFLFSFATRLVFFEECKHIFPWVNDLNFKEKIHLFENIDFFLFQSTKIHLKNVPNELLKWECMKPSFFFLFRIKAHSFTFRLIKYKCRIYSSMSIVIWIWSDWFESSELFFIVQLFSEIRRISSIYCEFFENILSEIGKYVFWLKIKMHFFKKKQTKKPFLKTFISISPEKKIVFNFLASVCSSFYFILLQILHCLEFFHYYNWLLHLFSIWFHCKCIHSISIIAFTIFFFFFNFHFAIIFAN